MLKKQQVFFVFLAIFAVNVAAQGVTYKGNMKHPDLPNTCYFKEHDLTIPVNGTANPTNIPYVCIEVFCREDFVLQIKNCDRSFSHCASDFSKPYPKCCQPATC